MSLRSIGVLVALCSVSVANADARDPVTLRVGTLAIEGSRYMKDILAFGKEIERRSRGSVRLDWVSGGRLGEETAMADLIVRGKLDGGGFSETGLSALVPEMSAWGAPGLFGTYDGVDRATAALDTTTRELFAKHHLVFAMWADLGFSNLFSSVRITSLQAALENASPWLGVPLAELVNAIANGSARGWELPPLYMLALGSTQVREMSGLRYRYVIGGLVFSHAAWSRLSGDAQATVLDVCRSWEPRIRARWRKESDRGLAALQKSGVKVRHPTATEIAAFTEMSAKVRANVFTLTSEIVAAAKR